MNMLGLSNQTSAARAGTNAAAYQPQMAAQVARNDTNASSLQGILGALGGIFGGGSAATPGINPNASMNPLDNPFIRSQLAALQLS